MKQTYYCTSIEESLREVSDSKPMILTLLMKLRLYSKAAISIVTDKFYKMRTKDTIDSAPDESMELQAGEWVEIRSMYDILLTLDDRRKYKGLYFMPAMEQFCGQKFKIFKKVDTILLESTGEIRKMRSPTFLLEGVYCDGKLYGGCGRSCFHFWRDVWLKRVDE